MGAGREEKKEKGTLAHIVVRPDPYEVFGADDDTDTDIREQCTDADIFVDIHIYYNTG